ncbi:hypothetical protein [Anaeromicropila populeti]|nr:hypothetical protein [Anaeromicropila populeti]
MKLSALNAGIVGVNVIVFSKGLLGCSIFSYNTAVVAFSITVVVMSIAAFFYGNYRLLFIHSIKDGFTMDQLKEPEDYVQALESYRNRLTFLKEINQAISQIERILRKKEVLDGVLYQNLKESAEDFNGLSQVVLDTNNLMYENIKKILCRLAIFDEAEYNKLKAAGKAKGGEQNNSYYAQYQLYQQHILYVKDLLEKNETILLEFDNLLIEVSKLGEQGGRGIAGLDSIKGTVIAMKKLRQGEDDISDLEQKYEK